MLIRIDGKLEECVTSKDIILHIIGIIGTAGGTGYTIEFAGEAVEACSMEARMSISNMAIEAGARSGIIAPDDVTYEYLKGRPMCPSGEDWDKAVAYWNSLRSDADAEYDETIIIVPRTFPRLLPGEPVHKMWHLLLERFPSLLIRTHLLVRYVLFYHSKRNYFEFIAYLIGYFLLSRRLVSSVLWNTLDWSKDRSSKESPSKRFSLDLVPTDVLRICAKSLPSLWAARSLKESMLWSSLDLVW
jgi:hypothetical protein